LGAISFDKDFRSGMARSGIAKSGIATQELPLVLITGKSFTGNYR
jgi:hypothetical protein